MDLLTIGDVSIDLYMKIDQKDGVTEEAGDGMTVEPKICFTHGTKIPVDHFETSIAGNALNVSIGCKYLGLSTGIYAEMGNDSNGEKILSGLKEKGIDTSLCHMNEGQPTNMHAIIVYGGDRTIFSYHEKYSYKIPTWPNTKWIYYTSLGYGFDELQPKLIDYKNQHPEVGFAFNPGTIQLKAGVDSFRNIMQVTDVFFCNKEEAMMIVGSEDIRDLHKGLHMLGVKLSVITDGKNGASAYDRQELINIAAYQDPRPVLDKTGAGDAFSSGFISALYYGKSLREALGWGAINSSCNIRVVGAITGICNKEQIEELYHKAIA